MKKTLISMLVLLMTAVTGAWAQEETLLTTIVNTGDNASFKSGSKTFDNIATVTFSGEVINYGDNYGWFSDQECTLTVTAAEGYTITRVKFYTTTGSAFDEEAPFEAILVRGDIHFTTKVNGTSIGVVGVTKIEVYGYVNMNHSANNTWTLAATPAFDVELKVEYFNITAPTANTADIYIGSTTPLINAGSTTEDGATMKYLVTATNEQPTSTDGFSADVPTAQATAITGPGTYYVWYYLDLDSGDDSDISALAVEVTVSVPTYKVTMKEGTLDATSWQGKAGEGEYQALPLEGVDPDKAVSVKYNGTKKVKSVKAKKKAKPAAEATAEDKGKLIGADGNIYADVAVATAHGTTAVAKIVYVGPTGHATYNHGLALALTDEGQMVWEAAIDACSAKNTSTPVTDATWLLASKEQWEKMGAIEDSPNYTDLRDGFSGISGASNLQSDYYWSSTEIIDWEAEDSFDAQRYIFGFDGFWSPGNKEECHDWVRACLAFGAEGSGPDPIELTSTDGETWTLASMPDYDVELIVEYEPPTAYETWAEENSITGAWNEKSGGIYNVFRYVFNVPSGAFEDTPLIDIAFEDGKVVVKTPAVANSDGVTVSVVESSDVAGKTVTATKAVDATGSTEFTKSAESPRFYRLKAEESE